MKGISHWVNPKNKFAVICLHYSASPQKDPDTQLGQAWIAGAKAGMPEEGWEREQEMSWTSGAGKPVYPDFSIRQAKGLKWNSDWVIYRGWDRGFHHPACHWSCVDNFDRWLWLFERMETDVWWGDFVELCIQITCARFPNAMIIDFFPPDTKIQSDATEKDDERSPLAIAQARGLAPIVPILGVLDGINLIRHKMQLRADGEYGLLVDPAGCPICMEALQGGYCRKENESKADLPVKDGYYDHLMDAARYTASGIFPLSDQKMDTLGQKPVFLEQEPNYRRNPVTGFIED